MAVDLKDLKTIRYEVQNPGENGIAVVTLDRPEARNAQNKRMTYELEAAFADAARRSDVKVIVFQADGPHFCSGHDLKETEPVGAFDLVFPVAGLDGALSGLAPAAWDRAALGISVTNFNEGGRLAVVQGNLIRNLKSKRPAGTDPNDSAGVGIAVEADASVTGNVIENAPLCGIGLGWGQHLRDVSVVGNVVRNASVGVSVSVSTEIGRAHV